MTRSRKRNQWIIVLGLVGAGGIVFFMHKPLMAGVFWLAALIAFIMYPQVTARSYKRHFAQLVDKVYADNIDAPLRVTIEEDQITIREGQHENIMDTAGVSKVFETSRYFFIIMDNNNVVTILKTERVGELRDLLKAIVTKQQATMEIMTNWEWK